jgi:hypothetical protein
LSRHRQQTRKSSARSSRGILAWRTFSLGAHCLLAVAAAWSLAIVGGAWRTQVRADGGTEDDGQTSREHRIKAAYLYQFGRYIEWPARAFAGSRSPFVIGAMEGNPIVADLDQIAEIKKIQDRPIRIQRFSSPGEVRGCHIVFLSASLPAETQEAIVRRVAGHGVLLVGEAEKFLDWGGAIRFVVEENKVRIHIARKAAQREGLTISAKLLQVAHVVD